MPKGALPIWMYARYLSWRGIQICMYIMRIMLVIFAWLLLVPYTTYRVWRMYFHVGDRIVDTIAGSQDIQGPRPASLSSLPSSPWPMMNWSSPNTWLLFSWQLVLRILEEVTDCWLPSVVVTGSIILSFVAVLLLREWVVQNMHETHHADDDEPGPVPVDAARERMRIAALATAQARAENMMAADPSQMARDDLLRAGETAPEVDRDRAPYNPTDLQDHHSNMLGEAPRNPFDQGTRDGIQSAVEMQSSVHAIDDQLAEQNADRAEDEWVDESESDSSRSDEQDQDPIPIMEPWGLDAAARIPNPNDNQFALPLDDDQDLDEDLDNWDEAENAERLAEDLESIFEAIGLHGPLLNFFQTLALVQAMTVSVITVFIALPFCIGRLLGFRVLDMVWIPAQTLRRVTDPVFEKVLSLIAWPMHWFHFERSSAIPTVATPIPTEIPLWTRTTWLVGLARAVQGAGQGLVQFGYSMQAHTKGYKTWERILCIMLGHMYAVLLLVAEAYGGKWLHGVPIRWATHLLRQVMLISKILIFSVVDLLLFPLFCGLLLEWCLFPLFPGASFQRLAGNAMQAPFTFAFCRWTSGTIYMFHFAQFLSAIRSVVRPGVLCWMRDAADPDFHPIKEILETRSTLQLRRIVDSMLMYGAVLVFFVGITLRMITWTLPNVLPLHWHPLTPVLHVPIDLVLVHFGLRTAILRTKLAHHSRRFFRIWWKAAARRLRLSEFLMGDNRLDERGYLAGSFIDQVCQFVWPQHISSKHDGWIQDGGYARVPADDHPAPDSQLIIPTDASGNPLGAEAEKAFEHQQKAIAKMKDGAAYTVVYLPPHLRRRVQLLLVMLWLSTSVVCTIAFLGPLLIGRAWAYVGNMHGMHDIYALVLGYTTLVAVYFAKDAWTQSQVLWRENPARLLNIIACSIYVTGTLLILIPFLIGVLLHQYMIPTQQSIDGVPQLNVMYTWCLGAITLNCALLTSSMISADDQPVICAVYELMQHGRVWRVPVRHATHKVLLPMLAYLIPAIVSPYVLAAIVLYFSDQMQAPAMIQEQVLRYCNIAVILAAGLGIIVRTIPQRLGLWTGVLRDELYLESTELCNYDQAQHVSQQNDHYGPLPDRYGMSQTPDTPVHRHVLDQAAHRLAVDKSYVLAASGVAFLGGIAGAMVYTRRRAPNSAELHRLHTSMSNNSKPVAIRTSQQNTLSTSTPVSYQTVDMRGTYRSSNEIPPSSGVRPVVDLRHTKIASSEKLTKGTPESYQDTVPDSQPASKGPLFIFREMNAAIFSAFRENRSDLKSAPAKGLRRSTDGSLSPSISNVSQSLRTSPTNYGVGVLHKTPQRLPDGIQQEAVQGSSRNDGPLLAFGAFSLATLLVAGVSLAVVISIRRTLNISSVEEFADWMHEHMPRIGQSSSLADYIPSITTGSEPTGWTGPLPEDVPSRLSQTEDPLEWAQLAQVQLNRELAQHNADRQARREQRAKQLAT
ncbi:RING-type E3 ubiquitin transferase [Malassezia yamatoensis]|uniref:RING-type E3 ubiquitin transferase n=1 Tax=Malassezia yamatoensis TaxID=253288 RepID=A0AAJ6CHH8_9BASI|nr:RING-type E3 ubiquitin transferase [Malassezia yamatoensis]